MRSTPPSSLPLSRLLRALATTLVLGATLSACQPGEPAGAAALPPPQIPVATPLVKAVPNVRQYPARVEAVDRVELRPRISGYVDRILFTEGSVVAAGQPLVEIDPRPYRAKLAEAEAAFALARSDLVLAGQERDRAVRLVAREALSTQELQRREAALAAAEARIAAATAAREAAALDLSFTTIVAPVAGRIGRAEVTPGNLVSAAPGGGTLLATLVSIDPVYVSFDVDESTALNMSSAAAMLPVTLEVAGESREGHIAFLDNELGRGTGTLRARATVMNADARLVPGMMGRVTVALAAEQQSLLIDEKAIGTDQGRRFVLVAGEEGTLEYRPIETGPMHGGLRVVRAGLLADDRVVVNGLMRVRPGTVIEPVAVGMERAAAGDYTPAASASLVAAAE
jgi:RND family efflux transporter MFP subunit